MDGERTRIPDVLFIECIDIICEDLDDLGQKEHDHGHIGITGCHGEQIQSSALNIQQINHDNHVSRENIP